VALLCALSVNLTQSAQGQTFTVLHNFTGPDGVLPWGGLVTDQAGNLYGTTRGGNSGGQAYKLFYRGSWLITPLYTFQGGNDGNDPHAGVVFGPDGTLYGTTWNGGGQGCTLGCGTIFNLRPPATAPFLAITPWTETVPHRFQGPPDGENPAFGTLVFDASGAAYGTTEFGGNQVGCSRGSCGTVFKLTRSGGQWTESVIYAFASDADGAQPLGGIIFDDAGNLFGTTYQGGQYGYGTVFELTPSQGGWTKTILHHFTGGDDGAQPAAALLRDDSDNLYGSTTEGGQYGSGGTVFEISPSGGGWNFSVLYGFVRGQGPFGPLISDNAGNLYGTTVNGGLFSAGTVFELSPSADGWTYTPLHDFTNGTDGGQPICPVLIGSDGALYGTASTGGGLQYCSGGCGVVWRITP
jgi:uncharacterized repeat protein (TIGR03803 family)